MNIVELAETELKLSLDKWQKEVLNYNGHITIRAGRQVGKSTVISLKCLDYAINNENKAIMVIAASQRQAELLFDKIKYYFVEFFPDVIAEDPTKTKIILNNGTKIYCLPAGRSGYTIRGYSIDLLIADEAAFIPEPVWIAITPMLAVTKGKIILLSTPFGKGGYFYNSFSDYNFKQFHISSENCHRIDRSFLEKEKERMSKLEYAQEYLGEFVEEFNQFFPTELIKQCCSIPFWTFKENYDKRKKYYMGVDVARYGGDENAFVIVELQDDDSLKCVNIVTTARISTTDTIGRVKALDELFKFRKIFVDDAGVGGGVTDVLIEEIGRKVVGINNASRSFEQDDEKRRRILKEDLYSHLAILMEKGKISMINDVKLIRSLRSVTFEYTAKSKNLLIYGNYTHIAEGLVRAAWCLKAKGLNLYCA